MRYRSPFHFRHQRQLGNELRCGLDAGDHLNLFAARFVEGEADHLSKAGVVPADIARRFGRRELAKKPILLLLEEFGITVGRAHQTISARLADVQVAQHLDIAVGSALLAVRRLIFDNNERPIQWLHGLYRPDRYEYDMQLSRVGSIDAKVWVSEDLSAKFN